MFDKSQFIGVGVIAAGNLSRTIRNINESDKTHYFVYLKEGIGYENEI